MAKVAERPQVADNGKIPEVPQQLPLECRPLLANWFMPVSAAPLSDAFESAPEAVRGGLLLHHPKSLAGRGPIVGEAQQVEGVGPGACIAVVVGRCRVPPVRSSEINQPGLLGVKRQAILRQPLRQHVENSPRVALLLEDDDHVISITNKGRMAGKSGHDLPHEPLIKHLMQVDVRQDWGNYSLNAKDNFIFERALRYR